MTRVISYLLFLAALVACGDTNRPSGDIPFDPSDPSSESEYRQGVDSLQVEIIESAVRKYQREQNQPVFQQRFRIVFVGEYEQGDRFDVRAVHDHWSVLLDPDTDRVRAIELVD